MLSNGIAATELFRRLPAACLLRYLEDDSIGCDKGAPHMILEASHYDDTGFRRWKPNFYFDPSPRETHVSYSRLYLRVCSACTCVTWQVLVNVVCLPQPTPPVVRGAHKFCPNQAKLLEIAALRFGDVSFAYEVER